MGKINLKNVGKAASNTTKTAASAAVAAAAFEVTAYGMNAVEADAKAIASFGKYCVKPDIYKVRKGLKTKKVKVNPITGKMTEMPKDAKAVNKKAIKIK